ncbi:MAG TPA: DUF6370 family protein [Gemmataceae bacterium]|jgi:hypothetical protein|nr:DUF6370 family protein [Gemmataceae bacterium]
MFRILSAFVVAGVMLAFVGAPVVAEEKAKEEKLEGKITCAKCDLGLADKCHTVIKVGDKVYWLDEASTKKYHKEICTAAKDGTVTGTVKKDGDKMIVTASKVEFKK